MRRWYTIRRLFNQPITGSYRGLSYVTGHAVTDTVRESPLTKRPCVYWAFKKTLGGGRDETTTLIDTQSSDLCGFRVVTADGWMPVFVKGADMTFEEVREQESNGLTTETRLEQNASIHIVGTRESWGAAQARFQRATWWQHLKFKRMAAVCDYLFRGKRDLFDTSLSHVLHVADTCPQIVDHQEIIWSGLRTPYIISTQSPPAILKRVRRRACLVLIGGLLFSFLPM